MGSSGTAGWPPGRFWEIRRRYRRPADGSKAKQWALRSIPCWASSTGIRSGGTTCLPEYRTAPRLDDVLALRDLVEQLQGVDLPTFPKSFGRN